MNRYTIYCTEEQTKKALALGAQIKLESEYYHPTEHDFKLDNPIPCKSFANGYHYAKCPTAEQMRGWLEGQGIYIIVPIPLINDFNKQDFSKADAFEYRVVIDGSEVYSGEYLSGKEATLAAIDAALEYLADNKL